MLLFPRRVLTPFSGDTWQLARKERSSCPSRNPVTIVIVIKSCRMSGSWKGRISDMLLGRPDTSEMHEWKSIGDFAEKN
jgi:hypothetical protein